VHFSEDVFAILAEHVNASVGTEADAPVFTGNTGQPLRPGAFWRAWNKARESTGLTQFHFHDLRHFAATQFSATEASTREVMERDGWKSAPMVIRYQHATSERDIALAEYLPALVPVACPDPQDEGEVEEPPYHRSPALTTQKAPGERLELST
jgi:integrase